MVGIWSTSHIFQHSFAETSLAYFRKYPCVERPDVLSVDLLKREFDPETGVLKTRRLITMDINVPSWVSKVFGISSRVYFLEDAEINSQTKAITTTSRNLSFSNLVESIEKCSYHQHENKRWTLFQQSANVRATGFMGFGSTIEELMMSTFRNNVNKGRDIMEQTINLIKREADEGLIWVEGITNKIIQEGEELSHILKEAEQTLTKKTEILPQLA